MYIAHNLLGGIITYDYISVLWEVSQHLNMHIGAFSPLQLTVMQQLTIQREISRKKKDKNFHKSKYLKS